MHMHIREHMEWRSYQHLYFYSLIIQAKFLAQMIVLGGQAVARAFRQALRQEYQGRFATAVGVNDHKHQHNYNYVRVLCTDNHVNVCFVFTLYSINGSETGG